VRARQLSAELSGGLRRPALIASAIALDPQVVIADEPVTVLDVTVRAQVLSLLKETKRCDYALIVISHDLAVVNQPADRVAVMTDGVIVEQGTTDDILSRPLGISYLSAAEQPGRRRCVDKRVHPATAHWF
jgi:peptide/nickel transport system ATP-binding protein